MMNQTARDAMLSIQSPESLAETLRAVADKYREDAMQLQSAWQDDAAGKVWTIAADNLDRTAHVIEKYWRKI